MMDFVNELIQAMEAREPLALATIVGPHRVDPGLLGRKLLVREDGRFEGSLGARSLDERVAVASRELMTSAKPTRRLSLALSPEECAEAGLAAGTKLDVFVEALLPPPTLLVVGAGHVAQPVAQLGKMLGFHVAVVDDRASFANRERFPDADQLIVADYGEALARFPITPSTFVVLVTRGHRHDEESLRQIIGSRAAYIGMIGSRRRVAAVLNHMEEDGFPVEQIRRVYSPIGLRIGAETPAEIAVSILAEITYVRRRGQPHPSSMSAEKRSDV